ncbi:MAG: zinc-dependent metalloprotease, partial [Planctomycetota bacterium]|nr:zinc-dependent metalloprotease [Planctomycetota bacterium]
DYPVHDVILLWQDRVLGRLLDARVLERIRDSELKVPADEDVFTTAELLERLTAAVMREVEATEPGDYTPRKPAIDSLRRSLQRAYATRLAGLAMSGGAGNPDAQALAAEQLRSLDAAITKLLARDDVSLDVTSRAHLAELQSRIGKVLAADLVLPRP